MSDLALDQDSINAACDAILTNDELIKHYVFEDVFVDRVIDLLVRPWDESNLVKYKDYVKELTNELRVLSNEPKPRVLHVVPALYPRPTTTIPEAGKATVGNLTEHLQKERVRSPFPQDEILTDFLTTISIREPVEESVMKPLARILAYYGRVFEDDDGNPLYELEPVKETNQGTNVLVEESSFTDDYED